MARKRPKKRLPAIADKAVWEKVMNVRAGINWESAVETVRRAQEGNQQETLSY